MQSTADQHLRRGDITRLTAFVFIKSLISVFAVREKRHFERRFFRLKNEEILSCDAFSLSFTWARVGPSCVTRPAENNLGNFRRRKRKNEENSRLKVLSFFLLRLTKVWFRDETKSTQKTVNRRKTISPRKTSKQLERTAEIESVFSSWSWRRNIANVERPIYHCPETGRPTSICHRFSLKKSIFWKIAEKKFCFFKFFDEEKQNRGIRNFENSNFSSNNFRRRTFNFFALEKP